MRKINRSDAGKKINDDDTAQNIALVVMRCMVSGKVADVHPDNVADMLRHGWGIVKD